MQFSSFFVTFLASAVLANPVDPVKRTGGGSSYVPCNTPPYSSPQCCATDVLGLADLDCQSLPEVPHNADDFRRICAVRGQRARCCVVPVLGQALLCQTPVGV
ncbi:cerato-ulmin [Durotheca rogersii]|uniref:cerato-ulmin n=1 Tax=Durotheca rogersii TaxID=419775 RepID=UPI0022200563|nr:cerato-ulmin [Durotheca rogersii]KAI5864010.1 cerato-ulmin [Durotheca rogersii]